MTVYYTLLGILLYLGVLKFLTKGSRQIETVLVWIGIIVLFLFAALRSPQVGADTRGYCRIFQAIAQSRWSDLLRNPQAYSESEYGYRIYNKLLSALGGAQVITFANSFLQMFLIAVLILKDSKDRYLSLLFYFSFCFYQTALNLSPSCYTSYFMFLSLPLIRKRRLALLLIWTACGMLFHMSAVFFIPLYFICYFSPSKRNLLLFSSIGVAMFGSYTFVLPIFLRFLPAAYGAYIVRYDPNNDFRMQLLVYFVQILPMFFILLLMNRDARKSFAQEQSIMIWTLMLESIMYLLSQRDSMFARGAYLFSPYVIIMIPEMIANIKSQSTRRMVSQMLVFYSIAIYIARVSINNVGTTIPYRFFWNSL